MKYLRPELELEVQALHPKVRAKLDELEAWSRDEGLPEPVVTNVLRTEDDQERLYLGLYLSRGHSPDIAREKARARFSWHLVACAVDLRNRHYTPPQRKAVMQFLRQQCAPGEWELLEHDIGRGDHIHVAVRDEQWRLTYQKQHQQRSAS